MGWDGMAYKRISRGNELLLCRVNGMVRWWNNSLTDTGALFLLPLSVLQVCMETHNEKLSFTNTSSYTNVHLMQGASVKELTTKFLYHTHVKNSLACINFCNQFLSWHWFFYLFAFGAVPGSLMSEILNLKNFWISSHLMMLAGIAGSSLM